MKHKKDRWAMLTPEQIQQNTIRLNVNEWRVAHGKKKEERHQFSQHFNSVGDVLEKVRVRA